MRFPSLPARGAAGRGPHPGRFRPAAIPRFLSVPGGGPEEPSRLFSRNRLDGYLLADLTGKRTLGRQPGRERFGVEPREDMRARKVLEWVLTASEASWSLKLALCLKTR